MRALMDSFYVKYCVFWLTVNEIKFFEAQTRLVRQVECHKNCFRLHQTDATFFFFMNFYVCRKKLSLNESNLSGLVLHGMEKKRKMFICLFLLVSGKSQLSLSFQNKFYYAVVLSFDLLGFEHVDFGVYLVESLGISIFLCCKLFVLDEKGWSVVWC